MFPQAAAAQRANVPTVAVLDDFLLIHKAPRHSPVLIVTRTKQLDAQLADLDLAITKQLQDSVYQIEAI